jgi:hypothetical protein
MDTDGKLPETLFKVYERFVTWLFGWECQKDPAFSPLAATETLEEAAFALTVTERRALPAAEWSRAVGRAVERIRAGAAANFEPDRLLRVLVSTGLVESFGGEITFSHKSMQEYFTASALIAKQALDHSVALEPGVTRFLCGAVHEIEPILERCLEACTDAASLMPLLQESSRAGADGGRFPELYEAIALGQELGIEITHGMYGPEAEQLIARVQDLVETCVTFGPKTISVLKAAADGVVRGTPWAESRSWFEHIVQGLERLGWPGSPHHRELLELGFFNAERWVTDDQDDLDDEKEFDDEVCDEDLFAYLQAAHEDNFAGAAEHLMAIRRVLGRVPETPVEGQGSLFDELE